MADMIVTGSGVLSPSRSRKKPKLALRGRRRKAVTKLRALLRVVAGQDAAEATRGEQLGYVPFLLVSPGTNPTVRQFNSLIARCNQALAATL